MEVITIKCSDNPTRLIDIGDVEKVEGTWIATTYPVFGSDENYEAVLPNRKAAIAKVKETWRNQSTQLKY